jgi:hypothetical protein
MIDQSLARLRVHRQNIERYRRLLETDLTVLERDFIERRIAEEESALNRLGSDTLPMVVKMPPAEGDLKAG